jgi:hypothetical protein
MTDGANESAREPSPMRHALDILDAALADDSLLRQLEDLLLAAVRARLDQCWRDIEATYDEAHKEGDAEPYDIYWRNACEERTFITSLLGAIARYSSVALIDGDDEIQAVLDDRDAYFGLRNTDHAERFTALPARSQVAGKVLRRGRPPFYRWQEFSAEMTRRCLERPINSQIELEKHMAQWCAIHWSAEPSESQIRDWVAPTFRIINGLGEAEKSATDLPVNTA